MPELSLIIDDPAPHDVTRAATKYDRKGVGQRLGGKSESYVRIMGEEPQRDRFTRFMHLFEAVNDAGRELFVRFILWRQEELLRQASAGAGIELEESVESFWTGAGRLIFALISRDGDAIVREGTKLTSQLGKIITYGRRLQRAARGEIEKGGRADARSRRERAAR